jgi:citrate/tricarballylate utilization protein
VPGTDTDMTSTLREADRLMVVCNSCRYCEGICAVFPAMEMRRSFVAGDLRYFANLCHGCGACYDDCQFAPPHEFDVNVPKVLAQLRAESYAHYAWPPAAAGLFQRNGLVITLIAALSVAAFIAGFAAWTDPGALFAAHLGPGSFYRLMPHNAMVAIFGAAFLYAMLAIGMGLRAFWRDGGDPRAIDYARAGHDAATLRNLDGGGAGCRDSDRAVSDNRRLFHHLTFYGFLLCFASTSVATLYHYAFGLQAPYAWYDPPVVLGTLGGIGLLIGPVGLLAEKYKREPSTQDRSLWGMDVAFLAMLFLTSLTGLALLVLRSTPAMGLLLAIHLGVVFGLFITLPYGKFVHGLYRYAALARYARERAGASAPSH